MLKWKYLLAESKFLMTNSSRWVIFVGDILGQDVLSLSMIGKEHVTGLIKQREGDDIFDSITNPISLR